MVSSGGNTASEGHVNDQRVRVGLVGAGRGGTAVLQLFASVPAVRVVAVAEPDPEAPGLALARGQGIPVVSSHRQIFAYQPQIVIEVTGRREVLEELERGKPVDVEVVGARSAGLFWEIIGLRSREARRLEKAETIRRIAGGVYHSLNNLFTTLLGWSGILLSSAKSDRPNPAQFANGLEVIANTLSRGSEILKRLRSLVTESAEEPVTRVDVNALVREVVALADPLIREAEARSARIDVDQQLGGVPPVVGRPSELLEVLLNLIVNAVEGMRNGGVLALESRYEGADVFLLVRDTGIGIPGSVKAKLFTPFFTTKVGGTGLGLSVSREIIRRHGGDLAVESAEGKGTCVTVRLPAAEAGVASEWLPDLQGWRILVADDDPFFRDVLVELLAGEGCQLEAVDGGEKALAALRRERYDLVLVDMMMPDIPGWQVARAARAQDPAPVVVLITGWAIGSDDPTIRDSGADVFLQKPIRLPDLLETVRGALAKRTQPSG
jgi:signal transduction histidine kinase